MNVLLIVATAAILAVAVLHGWFLVLEMFLWTKPVGRKTFGLTPEFAESTKVLAANQGLYNGFLVAGLLWTARAIALESAFALPLAVFFLGCVIVAGVFGAITVSRRILFVQAVPAIVALALTFLAHSR